MNVIKRPKTCSSSIINLLPSEVMSDILSGLPIPAISRSRSVCKDWNTITKDDAFINMHHSRVRRENPKFLLLCHINADMDIKLYSLSNYDNDDDVYVAVNTNYHFTPKKITKEVILVGAANGLACLSSVPYSVHTEPDLESFYICNPLTREVLRLPEAMKHAEEIDFYNNMHDSPSGFAYDATSDTYKVIHALPQASGTDTTAVEIFALGYKNWKRIPDVPTTLLKKSPVLCHGALHWETKTGHIGAIDVGAETFRALKQPPSPFGAPGTLWDDIDLFFDNIITNTSLCTLGDDLLCVAYEYESCFKEKMDIWSMKDYGVEDSWSKQYVIDKQMLGPLRGKPFRILTTPKDATLLLLGGKDQGYYDLESRVFRQIEIQGISQRLYKWHEKLYAFVHFGSLISPRRIAANKAQRRPKMKKQQQNQRKKKNGNSTAQLKECAVIC